MTGTEWALLSSRKASQNLQVRFGPIGKSWRKEVLEIGKRLELQRYLALRCIGNIVI
jgi:hypothetical protein